MSSQPLRLPNLQAYEAGLAPAYENEPLLSMHAQFAFETIGKLGEGGMGQVFKVRDKRLDRLAALKLLQAGLDKDSDRQRFLREAKITAQLDHPAIPPVFEAGQTTSGQLYLLMRLIKGQTLEALLSDIRAHAELQERRGELIQILIKVAEAVAYAHEQGIIHRDLKPENIMVGDLGEVLVMDWGIAKDLKSKVTEAFLKSNIDEQELVEAGATMAGSIVGTPGYMSPEQFDGQSVNGRSDVFSLGLILVELLTGEQALQAETTVEMFMKTTGGGALLPRTIDSSVPRELEWIARQALQVEIEERTENARELVGHLKAHLAGERLKGYRYSLGERARRFVSRHPGLVIGSAASLLLVALFSNLYSSLERERERSVRLALQSKLDIQREAKKREQAEGEANQAKNEAERAKSVLALFNEARALVRHGVTAERLEEVLTRALDLGRGEQQLMTAAKIYEEGRERAHAKALLEEVVRDHPPAYEALFTLHELECKRSKLFVTTVYLQRIIELAEKHGHENEFSLFVKAGRLRARGKFEEALECYDKIEDYTRNFPWAYLNRAALLVEMGYLDKGLLDFERAIALDPRSPFAYFNRGVTLKEVGRLKEAARDYTRAIELEPRMAIAHCNRGLVRDIQRRYEDAMADFNEAIRLKPKYAIAYNGRGNLHEKQGRPGKAVADYNTAIENDPKYPDPYNNLGILFEKQKKLTKALEYYNKAIECDPKYAIAYCNRGVYYMTKGRLKEALADYNRAIEYDPKNAPFYANRGSVLVRLGHKEQAIQDFETFLKLGPGHHGVSKVRGLLQRLKQERKSKQ